VLVDQQGGGQGDCYSKQGVELGGLLVRVDKGGEGACVEEACDPDGGFPSELCGDGVEVCFAVMVEVLECVDDVEACDPEEDHCGQREYCGGIEKKLRIDGDGGGDGGGGERSA